LSRTIRTLIARDRDEEHRAATQLELLFDLVIVIAIAAAAHGLRHDISHGHVQEGVIRFLMAFFCVWWPWNVFAWFASSFDNDDAAYRVNVMVIMIGAMFVAASMPGFFEFQSLTFTWIGYVIMRLASAALWLRAGWANPQLKGTAARYSIGQIAMQVLWGVIVFALEPVSTLFFFLFVAGVICELVVPWYAERAGNTHWHRHHIIERFGLLNIIVLGEVLLGGTSALESAFAHDFRFSLLVLPFSGIAIAFAMWWLYFSESDHLRSTEFKQAFVWSYGHFVVFASGAAVGAGLGVLIDSTAASDASHVDATIASFSVSIPVALYILGLWFVRDRYILRRAHSWMLLLFAALTGLTGFLPAAPVPTAIVLLCCLIVRLRSGRRLALAAP
jgi:low temperature requirement protein LtrA